MDETVKGHYFTDKMAVCMTHIMLLSMRKSHTLLLSIAMWRVEVSETANCQFDLQDWYIWTISQQYLY